MDKKRIGDAGSASLRGLAGTPLSGEASGHEAGDVSEGAREVGILLLEAWEGLVERQHHLRVELATRAAADLRDHLLPG
jgi:hypothetical protein